MPVGRVFTVYVAAVSLYPQVDIEAGLLVLCEEMEGQEQSMAHTIEFLDDLSLAAHDPSPPWQEFGDISVNLEAHVWVQIAVRFSHPVKSLPRDAISASVGAIFPHDLPTYELLKRQKHADVGGASSKIY